MSRIMDKIVFNGIQLDETCEFCRGTGEECSRPGNFESCSVCEGTGYKLTQDGRRLYGFIARHFHLSEGNQENKK